jgi:hypothetical protein
LHDHFLPIAPYAYGFSYVRDVTEMSKQAYHPVNIVRMVSALQKTLTRHIHLAVTRQQFPSIPACSPPGRRM